MEDAKAVVERYLAVWNEADPTRRHALIAATWTEDASYSDPLMQGTGHAALDALVQGVQAEFPGHRFRAAGEVDSHHDQIRFFWELAPASGTAIGAGTDFGVLAPDGRLQRVVGFLDPVPLPPAAGSHDQG